MQHRDYVDRQKHDAEYLEAEAEVRPALELAEDVVRLRVARGWSQTELAKKLGTSQANISRLEHGQANPTLQTLRKLGEVFGVNLVLRLTDQHPRPTANRECDPY